jgi:hypothetical protein
VASFDEAGETMIDKKRAHRHALHVIEAEDDDVDLVVVLLVRRDDKALGFVTRGPLVLTDQQVARIMTRSAQQLYDEGASPVTTVEKGKGSS